MSKTPTASVFEGCDEDGTPHWVVRFDGLKCGMIFTDPMYDVESAARLAAIFNDVAENGA